MTIISKNQLALDVVKILTPPPNKYFQIKNYNLAW